MIEIAIAEEYVFGLLSAIGAVHKFPVDIGPFDIPRTQGVAGEVVQATLYYQFNSSYDDEVNGPGKRAQSVVYVEIGVYSSARTFGASFRNSDGDSVSLTTLLAAIDAAFQENFQPVNKTLGSVTSCRRSKPIRIPEKSEQTGQVGVRNGGLYEIITKAF